MKARRASRVPLPAFPGAVPTFENLENRMRRFMEGDFAAFDGGDVATWMPAMEIAETAAELTLTAELPGMDVKDVDVSVDDGVMVIRGEKTEERKEGEEGKKFYLNERTYGAFERSFTLPRSVDAAKVTAEFTKGVLTVRMPKTNGNAPKGRKIEIGKGA
jgi:HSP20 family protein